MKWIRKNWFKLIIVFVSIVGFLWISRACSDAKYEKKIDKLDDEISGLKVDNLKLEDEMYEAVEDAKVAEKVVAEKEAEIAKSKVIIKDLQNKQEEVEVAVTILPPSDLIEQTREILQCAEVELTEDGMLYSVKCARLSLIMIRQFSLVKEELDETRFALSTSEEATHFQKVATWNVYRIAWSLGSQVMNYKSIVKKQGIKFDLSEKQRAKSFWSGLKIGVVVGVGISITFFVVIPVIKKLI